MRIEKIITRIPDHRKKHFITNQLFMRDLLVVIPDKTIHAEQDKETKRNTQLLMIIQPLP